MSSAITKAITKPPDPPHSQPIPRMMAVSSPSRAAVFSVLYDRYTFSPIGANRSCSSQHPVVYPVFRTLPRVGFGQPERNLKIKGYPLATSRAQSVVVASVAPGRLSARRCGSRRRAAAPLRGDLLLRQFAPRVVRRRRRYGPHPLAQGVPLVQQVADVVRGVVELGRPEQCIERTRLDADPAIHAEREVDREPVQYVALTWPGRTRHHDVFLVRVDVDEIGR